MAMQYSVEWGNQTPVPGRPCGRSAEMPYLNRQQAIRLAQQLIFVANLGVSVKIEDKVKNMDATRPRVVWISGDRLEWVSISRLDGVPRGAYAGKLPLSGPLPLVAGAHYSD